MVDDCHLNAPLRQVTCLPPRQTIPMTILPKGPVGTGFFTLRQNSPCSPGCVLRDPVESRALCTRDGMLTHPGRVTARPSSVLSLFLPSKGCSKSDTGMSVGSRASRTFLAHARDFPRSI